MAGPGDRHGISTGPNSRPLNETVAETGPGIADDAVADGELAPEDLDPRRTDEAVDRLKRTGWVGGAAQGSDVAIDESEAHPS